MCILRLTCEKFVTINELVILFFILLLISLIRKKLVFVIDIKNKKSLIRKINFKNEKI
jgi:hypothetical protein